MNILLVEDERLQLVRLQKEAAKALPEDTTFYAYASPMAALKGTSEVTIDVAFLDIEMAGMDGLGLAKELKKRNPKVNIVFVTAHEGYALDALRLHASGYLPKPVTAAKIREEIDALRFPLGNPTSKKLQIKCFGNFEIFHQGKPVKFSYRKSKEAFAYLIDREGSVISVNELNAVLWEEDHTSYLRNLISDIQKTLRSIHCEDVFIKGHNGCHIDVSKVDCDAYEYHNGNPKAIRMYRGEYMAQYSWAFFKMD